MNINSQKHPKLLNFQLSTAEEFLNKEELQNQIQHNQNISDQLLTPQELFNKGLAILQKTNNPEIEQDFRKIFSLYKSQVSDLNPILKQAYQDFIKTYHNITSLYLLVNDNDQTNLHIYDTESEKEEVKLLETSERLDWGTCLTKLPNGKLFCFGRNYPPSGITMIIDTNYQFQSQPPGKSCRLSSATYFNGFVYCFGGFDVNIKPLNLSERFDLNENKWFKLSPIPKTDCYCHSILYNGNFLISGYLNRNIWLYSIDIDSFSEISFEFAKEKRKILIGLERIYLIEHNGWIYESEVEDVYNWEQVAKSIIFFYPYVFWIYNKESIYIACNGVEKNYYKFRLDTKVLTKL